MKNRLSLENYQNNLVNKSLKQINVMFNSLSEENIKKLMYKFRDLRILTNKMKPIPKVDIREMRL